MTGRRVLVGGLWHETNTFSPIPTDLAAFERFALVEGEAMLDRFADTNTELGGIIGAAPGLGLRLKPSFFAGAVPSGPVRRDLMEHLASRVAAPLRAGAPPVEGAVLVLHGAMVAEGIDEADAFVARRLRAALPNGAPLVVVLNSHGNLTKALVDTADVIIGYDTLPHVDMAERGAEAARLLAELLRTGRRPKKAFRKLPLISVPQMQATGEMPMRAVSALREAIEREPGILTCTVMLGFPYADLPTLGMSVIAYADDQTQADAAAEALAAALWSRREAFTPTLTRLDEAVGAAISGTAQPVVLVEPADNVGGGAPGDGTHVLASLLAARAEGAVVTLWDPQAVRSAKRAGVGNRWSGKVGGKTVPLHGAPVPVGGSVLFADRVVYRRDKEYMTGQVVDLGDVAVVDTGGVRIVLTSERAMPFDTMHLRATGIDPGKARIITMKCGSNWSVAFGDVAAGHFYVDTPGITSSDVATLPYTRFDSSCFPLDRDARWPGA